MRRGLVWNTMRALVVVISLLLGGSIGAQVVSVEKSHDLQNRRWKSVADSLSLISPEKAFPYLDLIEKRSIKIHDTLALILSYYDRGTMLTGMGRYKEANENMIQAIKLADKQGHRSLSLSIRLNQLDGLIGSENYTMADQHIRHMENEVAAEATREDKIRFRLYKAEVFMYLKKLKESEAILQSVLKEIQKTGDTSFVMQTKSFLGGVYYEMGRYKQAAYYTVQCVEEDKKNGLLPALMSDYCMLAYIHLGLNDPHTCLDYLDKMMALNEGAIQVTMDEVYDVYYQAHKKLGHYKEALSYKEKSIAVKDSIKSKEEIKSLRDAENRFMAEKRQSQIQLLKGKQASDRQVIDSQRTTTYIAYLGLALAVLMLAGLGYGYYSSRRYNRLLKTRDKHRELLLREVHHRINNSLQIIRSLMNIQARATKHEEVRSILQQTESRVNSMASMHDILNESQSPVNINVKTYLNKVLEFYQTLLANRPEIEMDIRVADVAIPTNKAFPIALIVNELLTNAFKYAFPDGKSGKIEVVLLSDGGNTWMLRVSDDGIGLPEDYSELLKKSKGLGCQITSIMAHQLGAKLNVSNEGGTGYELRFSLKKAQKI